MRFCTAQLLFIMMSTCHTSQISQTPMDVQFEVVYHDHVSHETQTIIFERLPRNRTVFSLRIFSATDHIRRSILVPHADAQSVCELLQNISPKKLRSEKIDPLIASETITITLTMDGSAKIIEVSAMPAQLIPVVGKLQKLWADQHE